MLKIITGKILRFFSRLSVKSIEAVAVLACLILVGVALFVWRIASGPLDVSFATGYVQHALYDPSTGYSVSIGKTVIEWPGLKGPLVLELDDAALVRKERRILDIGKLRLGLSAPHLLIGQIEPVSISLSRPALQLIRTHDNRVVLSMDELADMPDITEEETGETPLMRIIAGLAGPDGTVDARSPLVHLRSLEIADAQMILEDHALGITWYLQSIDLLFARKEGGLALSAGIKLPGGRNGTAAVRIDAAYDRATSSVAVDAHVQDFEPRILSRKIDALSWLDGHQLYVDGDVSLKLDRALNITVAKATLHSDNGLFEIRDVYALPFSFQSLDLDVDYDRTAGIIDVKNAAVRAQDVTVTLSSKIAVGKDGMRMPVKIDIPALPQEKTVALWPDALRGHSIESWMTKQLSAGTIRDIAVSFDVAAKQGAEGWDTDVTNIAASFGIEDMTVDYRPPLLPVKKVAGKGKFGNNVLDISIDKGEIEGGMKVSNGRVLIDNIIGDEVGTAKITVDLKAGLPAVFRYVKDEPINMKEDDLGIDAKGVKGDADLAVSITLPTAKHVTAEQVKVDVKGTVDDLVLPDVLKDMDLSGGPLALTVSGDKVGLKGKALLEGRKTDFEWEQYLESKGKPYSSKVTASLDADRDLRERLGIGLDDWMTGTAPVHVVYTEFQDDRAEAEVRADVTPATVIVKPFGYEKPPGAAGTSTLKAKLVKGQLKEITELTVKTPELAVSGASLNFETVDGKTVVTDGKFPSFTLDETKAAIDLKRHRDGRMTIGVRGSFLDARPFLGKGRNKDRKKEPYAGPPLNISVDVATMRTHDERTIEKAKILLNMDSLGLPDRLEMDAIAGKGVIYFRLKPEQSGKLSFRLEADDAGAALRAFNIYENVRRGKIVMQGQSVDNGKGRRVITGSGQLNDFRVIKAPVLAQLVTFISPMGLPQLLSSEGLYFSRLESKFEWRMRRMGDLYVMEDGRTSGSSLGLTFDGTIDREKNFTDIEGHIVPISEINAIIGAIPLVGDILTGGEDGGVFAATYTIRGPSEKPIVSVNPLSVLAPGILRRMLFE